MRTDGKVHILHTFANNSSVPYLTWFAERAAREGNVHYTFLVMYPERPEMMDEMRALGFDCEWIRYDDRKRKRGMLLALPQLLYQMWRYKPDIVHCNLFDDTLPGLIAARLAGIKHRFMTRQDTGFHWMHAPRWVFLDRFNGRNATRTIAISGECERFLVQQEGSPQRKVTTIHNGLPPDRFLRSDPHEVATLKERFGIVNAYPVAGTIARFIAWKGYRHIVDAAALTVTKYPDAKFLFCGTGPQEKEVRRWVDEAGLKDHVVFTGWVDRSSIPALYRCMDLYLHAAVLEPFGFIFPEAMMSGIPVVTTRTGAAADVIQHKVSGILVDEPSGAALFQGMDDLLHADPSAIGEAGKTAALEKFTFDTMWKGYMKAYRDALDGNS